MTNYTIQVYDPNGTMVKQWNEVEEAPFLAAHNAYQKIIHTDELIKSVCRILVIRDDMGFHIVADIAI